MYKIKKPTANKKPSPNCAVVSASSLPTDSTIKDTNVDDYEYPENIESINNTRYQSTPSALLQPNPAYGMERFDKNDNTPVYENLK